MKRQVIKYIRVKDGNIELKKTKNLKKVFDKEFKYFFDTRDGIFDHNYKVRAFVKDESLYTDNKTISIVDENNQEFDELHDTVFFANLDEYSFRTLTKKDIDTIRNNLIRTSKTTFKIINHRYEDDYLNYYYNVI